MFGVLKLEEKKKKIWKTSRWPGGSGGLDPAGRAGSTRRVGRQVILKKKTNLFIFYKLCSLYNVQIWMQKYKLKLTILHGLPVELVVICTEQLSP